MNRPRRSAQPPADAPPARLGLGPKRICTWVRLRDRPSGRTLRLYNTHLYLTERARLRAVRIILGRIATGDPADAVLYHLILDSTVVPLPACVALIADAATAAAGAHGG